MSKIKTTNSARDLFLLSALAFKANDLSKAGLLYVASMSAADTDELLAELDPASEITAENTIVLAANTDTAKLTSIMRSISAAMDDEDELEDEDEDETDGESSDEISSEFAGENVIPSSLSFSLNENAEEVETETTEDDKEDSVSESSVELTPVTGSPIKVKSA